MAGHHTRNLIRILIGSSLCTALVACAVVPVPANLPAIACQQAGLYRLEVALLVFYGVLLLITPTFSGLIRGRLPTEISTRGAKFAEEADYSAEQDEAAIERLQETTTKLARALTDAHVEIRRLSKIVGGDNTHQEVGSER